MQFGLMLGFILRRIRQQASGEHLAAGRSFVIQRHVISWLAFIIVLPVPGVLSADENSKVSSITAVPAPGAAFQARDSLKVDTDSKDDANECLQGLRWEPSEFHISCEAGVPNQYDLLVRFPSPAPAGDPINDRVAVEWYMARSPEGIPQRARAVVVVHESGSGMTIGRVFARGLAAQGLHAFMVQLPGYGVRKTENMSRPEMILNSMKQAVADTRRARDVAVTLPLVDGTVVGIQGTSLGGFITCTTAGLDSGFDRVFILLAGGNLHDVVLKGARDAAKVREKILALGITPEQIQELARPVEPLRLAHRLNAANTWLYSGKYDDVVPPACSFAFAEAAGLPAGHHIEMPADHYSGIIFLPSVIVDIRNRMEEN